VTGGSERHLAAALSDPVARGVADLTEPDAPG